MSTLFAKKVNEWVSERSTCELNFTLIDENDAEFTFGLRTDPERNRYVSGPPPTVEAQAKWIRDYKQREENGSEFYFRINYRGTPWGTVRLYDFRENSFCWGSWMIKRGAPASVAVNSAHLIYELGFSVLGFESTHFEVRLENASVRRFHTRMGAKIVSEDEVSAHYVYSKADYLQHIASKRSGRERTEEAQS